MAAPRVRHAAVAAPAGRSRIAQRFIAGIAKPHPNRVPEGRLNIDFSSIVPPGLRIATEPLSPSDESLGYCHSVPSGRNGPTNIVADSIRYLAGGAEPG